MKRISCTPEEYVSLRIWKYAKENSKEVKKIIRDIFNQKKSNIIIDSFYLNITDKEVGERYKVNCQYVNRIRNEGLHALLGYLKAKKGNYVKSTQ